jgi:hypothetical protein
MRARSDSNRDHCVQSKNRLAGVEVKSVRQPGVRGESGPHTFLAEHLKQAPGGIVVHGGDESGWLDVRIVPVLW